MRVQPPTPSPKKKKRPKVTGDADQSLNWNIENETGGKGNLENSGRGVSLGDDKDKKRKQEKGGGVNFEESVQKKREPIKVEETKRNKERILRDIINEDTEEDERPLPLVSGVLTRPGILETPQDKNREKNIFKEFGDHKWAIESENEENRNKNRERSVGRDRESENKPKKKLEIPANLNLNETKIEFLKDVQNVLHLFSDLKSKIETLQKDKQSLKEELKRSNSSVKKYQDDLQTKNTLHTQVLTQLNMALQENKNIMKENSDLKSQLKEMGSIEQMKAEIEAKDSENNNLKMRIKKLTIDQEVLKKILWEVVHEKNPKVEKINIGRVLS